jgi:hypothetical protein
MAEQLGVSCPGSSMCTCTGGDFRTVPTSCTCNETGALGRIFECADACAAACASDAGVPDAGKPPVVVSCAEYCAHLNTVRCDQDFSACEAACESLREMGCPDEMNALLACSIDAPVVCSSDGQLPVVTGCEAEDAAWSDCFSP